MNALLPLELNCIAMELLFCLETSYGPLKSFVRVSDSIQKYICDNYFFGGKRSNGGKTTLKISKLG